MHANAWVHRIIDSRIVLETSSPTCSISAHLTPTTTTSLDHQSDTRILILVSSFSRAMDYSGNWSFNVSPSLKGFNIAAIEP
ncbi:hypothetical protein JAAARDRAFT_406428 [Jaapia argillacea MUCL 33604]|uniref:Uncharacterized protein n=1 Tax=Jaapia argillacea MUCL 33604 TaxID=933084 RepID=A0A067PKI6_9AGAM|nr:hypothetical protein JAAARDRAFT_406428 [Jaapia argillacea MUCL 33604]